LFISWFPRSTTATRSSKGLANWVKSELGPDVPLHFSRFHPEYLLKNLPPTPIETLERAKAIADAEGLHYVYIGNVPGHPAESTYCPHCRKKVVDRTGLHDRRHLSPPRQVPILPHADSGGLDVAKRADGQVGR
jgi:hypothetical protein